jgi:hypothetical protein
MLDWPRQGRDGGDSLGHSLASQATLPQTASVRGEVGVFGRWVGEA